MDKKKIDVDKELDSLRKACSLTYYKRGKERIDYEVGYIHGILEVLGKNTQDLCAECGDCDKPVPSIEGLESKR